MICFHIINSSIDAPDILPDWVSEDLSYNEIESVTEWILEVVISDENCIQEYDGHDENKKKIQLKKKKNYYCNSNTFSSPFIIISNAALIHLKQKNYLNICDNIHSPPPEFII